MRPLTMAEARTALDEAVNDIQSGYLSGYIDEEIYIDDVGHVAGLWILKQLRVKGLIVKVYDSRPPAWRTVGPREIVVRVPKDVYTTTGGQT